MRRQQIWTKLLFLLHTVLLRLLHMCIHGTRYVILCLQACKVWYNNKTIIVMVALLWQRFLTVVVDLCFPTKQHASVLQCPKQPWWALLLLQLKQRFNFIYYVGLKLVCAVKDRFLWETYIAGSAIFSEFPGTFSEVKVAIKVYILYLKYLHFTIILHYYYPRLDHITYDYIIMLFEFMCICSYSIGLL